MAVTRRLDATMGVALAFGAAAAVPPLRGRVLGGHRRASRLGRLP